MICGASEVAGHPAISDGSTCHLEELPIGICPEQLKGWLSSKIFLPLIICELIIALRTSFEDAAIQTP